MILIPKLNKSILPYPPQKNYGKILSDWLKKNPWVTIGDGVMFPSETKVLGTITNIKDGTIVNGPMVIKGSGSVTIGKYGGIAENLYIISSNHKIDHADLGGMFSENLDINKGPIYIGNNVWIGDNVTILTGVTIGDGAAIGAGSVVTRDIPPFAVAVGAPAKVIKYRFSENIIDRLLNISWWHWDYKTIQKNKSFFNTQINDKNIDSLESMLNLSDDSEVTSIDLKENISSKWLLEGWGPKEDDGRWVVKNQAGLIFKVKDQSKYQTFTLCGYSYYAQQSINIFVNGEKIDRLLIKSQWDNYLLHIRKIKKGINTINLVFEKGYSPSNIDKNSDKRILYCRFSSFTLI
ncbi:MAG: acetyltransferase (isoleucine patch superfamily)-like protein [uncultured bacterium]|nr:MAG: acetyltransferase (isoleucine patch superfamily)-like protein [uncultured bacterium]